MTEPAEELTKELAKIKAELEAVKLELADERKDYPTLLTRLGRIRMEYLRKKKRREVDELFARDNS